MDNRVLRPTILIIVSIFELLGFKEDLLKSRTQVIKNSYSTEGDILREAKSARVNFACVSLMIHHLRFCQTSNKLANYGFWSAILISLRYTVSHIQVLQQYHCSHVIKRATQRSLVSWCLISGTFIILTLNW